LVPLTGIVDIVVGTPSYYLCLRKDGTVWGWGDNAWNELGKSTKFKIDYPELIDGIDNVKKIFTAHSACSFAVKNDGTVWGWGDILDDHKTKLEPVHLSQLNDVKKITGNANLVVLKNDGTLWKYEIHSRNIDDLYISKKILENVIDVCANGSYPIAVKEDGSVWLYKDGAFEMIKEFGPISPTPEPTPTLTPTSAPTDTPEPLITLGDVNGDGEVNSIDFAYLKQYLLVMIKEFPAENGLKSADLDGNGSVNSIDYAYLKKYLLGIIDKFPASQATE